QHELGNLLARKLVDAAHLALGAKTFLLRNEIHGRAVAEETSLLTLAAGSGNPPSLRQRLRGLIPVGALSGRNAGHAALRAQETAALASKVAHIADPATRSRVYGVFEEAVLAAGGAFSNAFDEAGVKIAQEEGAFKSALSAAGPIAYRALPKLLLAIDP